MAANSPTPLLILSDAVTAGTGLARITKDLATRIHAHLSDIYRVGTVGYGGLYDRSLGFPQYNVEVKDWVIPQLPEVWQNFAGKEKGVLLCIWDPSRLGWLSQPQQAEGLDPGLRSWLLHPPFRRWIYAPVDAEGPNGRLTFPLMQVLFGFDRILAYGPFGEGVIRETLAKDEAAKRNLSNLPHGVDSDVFFETERRLCRKMFLKYTGASVLIGDTPPIQPDERIIGCVATNQNRKDWALAVQTIAILAQSQKLRFWVHTDSLERYWSIPALLVDYEILDKTVISLGHISDDRMSIAFSACDLTLGPGPEGFGLPIAESLACGTPVVTGSYAGAADFVPQEMQVDPVAFRYEGLYSCKRPVYDPQSWAEKAMQFLGKHASLDCRYRWNDLWPRWRQWFEDGAKWER